MGSIMMAGETIATIAANEFLLRLEAEREKRIAVPPADTPSLADKLDRHLFAAWKRSAASAMSSRSTSTDGSP
jgi:hypothetical protein